MIPLDLQASLVNRMKDLFKSMKFHNPDGEKAQLNVFEQHLPEKETDEESEFYPYILVQLDTGEQISEVADHTTKVHFFVGVYDQGKENLGHREVIAVINTVFNNLNKYPLESKKFELNYPIRWGLHEEDMAPFYFGMVETNWTVPSYNRMDVEALI